MATHHVPILVKPIVDALAGTPPGWILDCTLGGGGHASAVLNALGPGHRIIAIDQDEGAALRGRERFARELASGRMEIHHARMSETGPLLEGKVLVGVLADLGFSSDQIDDPTRGLSFQKEGPLDMRLDPSRGQSAKMYLSRVPERELEKILAELGEEKFSRRIASAIILSRREGRLPSTTKELSELVVRAIPPGARHGKIHAATRTFQALRIHVNDEINELEYLLTHVILGIQPGGRAAILSFHSLEDRRVKLAFKSEGWSPLTKKPIEADDAEIGSNPRARSAKLRIAERIG
jgi:16S rRNA (cytosine1402-N4)-methyltransferase